MIKTIFRFFAEENADKTESTTQRPRILSSVFVRPDYNFCRKGARRATKRAAGFSSPWINSIIAARSNSRIL
ncbi:hypothetical protein PUN28_010730 [Cardiocondyla obscurior]|uniref:Uncharacterized protein n=1 Tax=Cardiocondyla obscurior TaxID=286306 RepID=A0AAW2FN72_9HYME